MADLQHFDLLRVHCLFRKNKTPDAVKLDSYKGPEEFQIRLPSRQPSEENAAYMKHNFE